MTRRGLTSRPLPTASRRSTRNTDRPCGLALDLLARRRAREQDHEVGELDAGDVHLAPVDDVVVAVADGHRAQRRRVRPRLGLRDAEGLQPQLAAGDAGQVGALLLLRAVPEQRAHRVDLRVRRLGVAAGAVDLLEDDRGARDVEPEAAVLLGDQRARGSRPSSARRRPPRGTRGARRGRASRRPGTPRRPRGRPAGARRGRPRSRGDAPRSSAVMARTSGASSIASTAAASRAAASAPRREGRVRRELREQVLAAHRVARGAARPVVDDLAGRAARPRPARGRRRPTRTGPPTARRRPSRRARGPSGSAMSPRKLRTSRRPWTIRAATHHGRLNFASYSVTGTRLAASGSSTIGTPTSGMRTTIRSIASGAMPSAASAAASTAAWIQWQAGYGLIATSGDSQRSPRSASWPPMSCGTSTCVA